MANKKQKYYVVWQGNKPGIYNSWDECKCQINGVAGAKYKSYESLPLAEQAFRVGPEMSIGVSTNKEERKAQSKCPGSLILDVDNNGMTIIKPSIPPTVSVPILNSLAVDAACSGNPGVMEYQGVYVASRTRMFHFKMPMGTNNIGEFLAIVHGLAYLKKNNLQMVLYSDSVNAINWVRVKQCRTKLPLTSQTAPLYDIIHRAENWLRNNIYTTEIRKWDTDSWGEIPADFNRK